MESIIDLDRQFGVIAEGKDASEANAAWIAALSTFNRDNADDFNFVDRFGLETKANLLIVLSKHVNSNHSLSQRGQPSPPFSFASLHRHTSR